MCLYQVRENCSVSLQSTIRPIPPGLHNLKHKYILLAPHLRKAYWAFVMPEVWESLQAIPKKAALACKEFYCLYIIMISLKGKLEREAWLLSLA